MKELKLLIIDHFNRHGGAQEYIIDIAKELCRRNISCYIPETNVITLKEKTAPIPSTGFTVLSKSFVNPLFYFKLIYNIIQVRLFIIKNKITIIHCNSIPVLLLAMCVKSQQKIFFTCHDCSLNKIKLFLISHCCDVIISVSETVQHYLQSHGIRKKNIILYNGFEDYRHNVTKDTLPLKKNNKTVTFGCFGRIEKWKGGKLFIEAAKRLLMTNTNLHFNIVGYSEDKKYYTQLKEDVKKYTNFRFIPFCNDKYKLYSDIDVLVNASVECEPFGRTLVEAYIFSLPVIGPDYGGPSEIIIDGKTGLLFKFRDENSLYEKMKILAESPAKRKSFGIEGRKRFEETFHIDTIVNQIISVYQKNN